MDRDPNVYADSNHVQWTADPRWMSYNTFGQYPPANAKPTPTDTQPNTTPAASAPLDGFEVARTGDVPTRLRITIHLNHIPDRIKLSPQLASILCITEDTRSNILNAFWHYVKVQGLQDKNDRKLIRLDDRLRSVFR